MKNNEESFNKFLLGDILYLKFFLKLLGVQVDIPANQGTLKQQGYLTDYILEKCVSMNKHSDVEEQNIK